MFGARQSEVGNAIPDAVQAPLFLKLTRITSQPSEYPVSLCGQAEALIDEYFNSGDMQEASTTLQVHASHLT